MEPASTLHGVSFRKNPREGQRAVFDRIAQGGDRYLNVKLPTGYGKTFVCCGSYSILKAAGRVNRLFVVFPSDGQLEQFKNGGKDDLRDAGVSGSLNVVDLRFFGTEAIKKHRKDEAQVYVITVQSLINRAGAGIARDLFASGGRWMLCVDEYHHYGMDGAWGKAASSLPAEFTLAMSATPNRKDDDSAFGAPDVVVKYRDAVEEKAVKPLVAHSYVYRLDVINDEGDVESLTTNDLVEQAGGDSPQKIESFLITRKMRWSPKYVSPLVSIPLERLLRDRVESGYRLQAIIGAMSVSHAEMVCKQVESMFGDVLTVDWVGTGDDGRKPDANKKILERFCPPKNDRGERDHTLDVLVHVGMAGEGLDSVDVSEVIHLNKAAWNNSNDQENGRAARYRLGVTGHINFDSTSEYAKKGYIGDSIMDAMDNERPKGDDPDTPPDPPSGDYKELPDEPTVIIHEMELDHIDSGMPEVVRMKKVLALQVKEYSSSDIDDPSSSIHEAALKMYREMRRREAEQDNEESTVRQWQDSVKSAATAVTGLAIKKINPVASRVDRTLAGDIKRRINSRKKRDLGALIPDVETCRRHYAWIKSLERQLLADEVPQWLL